MCEYIFKNGEKCKEDAFENSEYCILHMPFPDDKNSDEFKRIAKLKEEKVKEKISKGDFNFEGAKLLKIDFSNLEIKGDVNFSNAVILEDALFDGAEIGRGASFDGVKIEGKVSFYEATIGRNAWFDRAKIGGGVSFGVAKIGGFASFGEAKIGGFASFIVAKIGGYALFEGAEIGGFASFQGATIGKDALFDRAKIKGDALFEGAKIKGDALFEGAEMGRDASFDGVKIEGKVSFGVAKIGGFASFNGAEIKGDALFNTLDIKWILSFKNALFKKPEAEENACRAARRSYERLGNREEADEYFYREMRARRKQKNKITQFFEWLLADFACQYGTDFIGPITMWFALVIVVFPLIYYFGHGIISSNPFFPFFQGAAGNAKSLLSAEYFSVVTATTLGYGDLQPASTIFRLLASFEAIFGTFMWVIFLTVFARKYMR